MTNPQVPTLHLNIAEIIVTKGPAVVSTVLGSCISVCLFSKKGEAGGIIHYALPNAPANVTKSDQFRYGDLAIPALVEELKKMTGLKPSDFVAKIVGGAGDVNGSPVSYPVGKENIEIAKKYMKRYGIEIVGESVGEFHGRKVFFHIPSGRLQVGKVGKTHNFQNPVESLQKIVKTDQVRRVLIVDDSKVVRDLLTRILSEDPQLKVIGAAEDPIQAEKFLEKEKPDVITLDVHMPKMSGVEWLEKLMPRQAIPVVMISSLQLQDGNEVFRALEIGAVDYIQKPVLAELATVSPLIREKVKEASFAKVFRNRKSRPAAPRALFRGTLDSGKILAIGASTGGTEALKDVLCALPAEIPPTVIVQHIPPVFSKAFADRLNGLCPFEVKEAEDGDLLQNSRVLIAPGGKQMKLQKTPKGLCVRINDDAPMNRHKPSVDYLFYSVASLVGNRAVGVILTGMGADGAKGLLEMKNQGASTIGQDEASCVVYGMPKAAFDIGAVQTVGSLDDIPKLILQRLERKLSA